MSTTIEIAAGKRNAIFTIERSHHHLKTREEEPPGLDHHHQSQEEGIIPEGLVHARHLHQDGKSRKAAQTLLLMGIRLYLLIGKRVIDHHHLPVGEREAGHHHVSVTYLLLVIRMV